MARAEEPKQSDVRALFKSQLRQILTAMHGEPNNAICALLDSIVDGTLDNVRGIQELGKFTEVFREQARNCIGETRNPVNEDYRKNMLMPLLTGKDNEIVEGVLKVVVEKFNQMDAKDTMIESMRNRVTRMFGGVPKEVAPVIYESAVDTISALGNHSSIDTKKFGEIWQESLKNNIEFASNDRNENYLQVCNWLTTDTKFSGLKSIYNTVVDRYNEENKKENIGTKQLVQNLDKGNRAEVCI